MLFAISTRVTPGGRGPCDGRSSKVSATADCVAATRSTAGPVMKRPAHEREERGPVGQRRVAAAMLAERNVAVDEGRFHRRKIRRPQILLPEERVNRTGADGGEEHALRVDPASFDLLGTDADEERPRCAQRNQFVRIDRQIAGVQRSCVFDEIAGDPVVLAGTGHVLDLFAEIAPMQFGAALARRSDEANREALIVGHRDERSLAVPGQSFDADLFRVDGVVSLEVVECAAGAPRPRAQRAPVVHVARLSLVHQADDAVGQARAVVGLHARRNQNGVAPAFGEHLLLPCRPRRRWR